MPAPTLDTSPSATASAPSSALARGGLVVLMVIGSLVMWFGMPLGVVYLVSHTFQTTTPNLGAYLLVIFGAPVGMIVMGRVLGSLDRRYGELTARDAKRPQAEWLKSIRGERTQARWEVLDVVMIVSVCAALALTGIWFVFFASPL